MHHLNFDEQLTLPRLLENAAISRGDQTALIVDEEELSYRELRDRAHLVAQNLSRIGVGRGDRVGLLMQNSVDLICLLFGSAYLGATAVVFNARFAPGELSYVLRDSEISCLFVGHHGANVVNLPQRVRDAVPELFSHDTERGSLGIEHLFVFGTELEIEGFQPSQNFYSVQTNPAFIEQVSQRVSPEDTYLMLYTSGTTSNPKGCLITHESMVSNGMLVGREGFQLVAEDVMWNTLPLFHVSSLTPLHAVIDAGGTFVSALHYDPERALETIETRAATIIFPSYPAVMQPLLNSMRESNVTLPRVRVALTAGPPESLAKYQEQLPAHIVHISCYGSTEIGGIATIGRLDDPITERVATGKPLTNFEFQVRDLDTGVQLTNGESGALWVRSRYLFTGYHVHGGRPHLPLDDQGWFDTGDMASIDIHGNIFHKGRTKDMLKVGGENVAAAEVEAVLLEHPAVAIAAVVGKPDDRYQEVPVAFIELQPGADYSESDLTAHLTRNLAKYKVPREIHLLTEWPMSATKIQKFKLLAQL